MKNRLNIAARLILGNTFAIVTVVGGYGYINAQRIESIFAEQAERETSSRMEDLRERGLAEAKRIATNTVFALSNNDFGFLQNLLKPLVEADASLAFAFLVDQGGSLVAEGSREGFQISEAMVESERKRTAVRADVRQLGPPGRRVLQVGVPIESGDRAWGRVVLGYSLERLSEQLAALERWRADEVDRSMAATVVFATVLAFIGILATIVPSISVTRPLLTLTRAAEQLAKGELGLSVDVKARGEVGLLATTFNRMSVQLAELVDQVKTTAALEKELEVAQTVQAALIPEPVVHRVGRLEISGRYIPASRCGGDWWSFFPVSEHKTLLLVGDVTGHGVPTTLITASVNACCEELQHTTEEMSSLRQTSNLDLRDYLLQRGSLAYLLAHLNRSISRVGRGQFLMTFSAALIDASEDRLTYASAGHEAPLLLRGDARSPIEPLHTGPSVRLGEAANARFQEKSHPFQPGDTIAWYTDGLVDALNLKRRPYGEGRLLRNLAKHRLEDVDRLTERVVSDVLAFAERDAAADDMTLVVVRRSSESHGVIG